MNGLLGGAAIEVPKITAAENAAAVKRNIAKEVICLKDKVVDFLQYSWSFHRRIEDRKKKGRDEECSIRV